MTLELLAADIVDRIHGAPQESKLTLTLLVRDLIRDGLPAVHPNLKQCRGCKAIWTADKFEPHNICSNCGGQCGGVRVSL